MTAPPPKRSGFRLLRLEWWYDRPSEPRRLVLGLATIIFCGSASLYLLGLASLVLVNRADLSSAPAVTVGTPLVLLAEVPRPSPTRGNGAADVDQHPDPGCPNRRRAHPGARGPRAADLLEPAGDLQTARCDRDLRPASRTCDSVPARAGAASGALVLPPRVRFVPPRQPRALRSTARQASAHPLRLGCCRHAQWQRSHGAPPTHHGGTPHHRSHPCAGRHGNPDAQRSATASVTPTSPCSSAAGGNILEVIPGARAAAADGAAPPERSAGALLRGPMVAQTRMRREPSARQRSRERRRPLGRRHHPPA